MLKSFRKSLELSFLSVSITQSALVALISVLFISLIFVSCSNDRYCQLSKTSTLAPGWTWSADLDKDGKIDQLEIIMQNGKPIHDRGMWAGGGDRYQGLFLIKTRFANGQTSYLPLNNLFYKGYPGEPMSFRIGQWKMCFHDYNKDGRIDFNIGQYFSSVNYIYKIFSTDASGRVIELPILDHPGGIPCSDTQFSTASILPTDHGFTHCYYDRLKGRQICNRYTWNKNKGGFLLENKSQIE